MVSTIKQTSPKYQELDHTIILNASSRHSTHLFSTRCWSM